jgi:integrase
VLSGDKAVRAAQPTEAVYELDADGHGLVLRVWPSGRKSWSLRYRTKGGDRRRKTIGEYPDVGLAYARTEAAKVRDAVRQGRDPNAEREAEREAMRMVALLGVTDSENERRDAEPGWFLGTYCKTAGKLGKAKTDKSIATDRSYIANHLRKNKNLMQKKIIEVTVADLEKIKAKAPPGAWRKVRNILRVCFRHAEELNAIPHGSNPATRTKAVPERKVERYLSPDERKKLDAILRKVEKLGPSNKGVPRKQKGGVGAGIVRAIRLLSLTGMRRGAVLALRWEQIDWHLSHIRVGDKTHFRVVPLTPQALRFFESERGDAKRIGLICTTSNGTLIDPDHLDRAWRRIRHEAGLDDVRLHDLRHSWASDAASAGIPLAIIGYVLGHKSVQTTMRYAHLHAEAVTDALARAGEAIERATEGASVIPIDSAKAKAKTTRRKRKTPSKRKTSKTTSTQ